MRIAIICYQVRVRLWAFYMDVIVCRRTVRESARWLYASGNSSAGEAEFRRIAKVNKTEEKLGEKIDVTVSVSLLKMKVL